MTSFRFSLLFILAASLCVACSSDDDTNTNDSDAVLSDAASETTSAGEDPLGMVAAHNAARRRVNPAPAVALPDMRWDASLAATAQAWADRCVFEHSSNRFGENLYISSASSSADEVVRSWESEVADYDYASDTCSAVCGHYTQVVWRDSIRVGCAFTDCDSVEGFGSGQYWVCNYDPPGNYVGEKPY